ncbi:MAG: dihydrofolate reductase [Pedobacter sp.]|nr:MAG: dihydrofolate reductase [Pedobacter sp.]
MRKVVAAINLTLDGFIDHTAVTADKEIHLHYEKLLDDADTILYGRITYDLMKFWQQFLTAPSGEKDMDNFAVSIDKIHKIIFSNTLSAKDIQWDSANLADKPLEEVIKELKKQPGRDILIGSRSLIVSLTNFNLIDEYQFCVHPVVVGKGLPLFDKLNEMEMDL